MLIHLIYREKIQLSPLRSCLVFVHIAYFHTLYCTLSFTMIMNSSKNNLSKSFRTGDPQGKTQDPEIGIWNLKSKTLDTCHTWDLRYKTIVRTKERAHNILFYNHKLKSFSNKFYLNARYKVEISNNTAVKFWLIVLLDSDSF